MKTRLIIFLIAVIIGETLNQFAMAVADPIMGTNAALATVNGGVAEYAFQATYRLTSTYVRLMLILSYVMLAFILFGSYLKSGQRQKQPTISNQ